MKFPRSRLHPFFVPQNAHKYLQRAIMKLAVVILAAGKGTRMQSDKAKVLHHLCGQSLVAWVLKAVQVLAPARTVVITGHQSDAVRTEISAQFPDTEFALQTEMNGTGHAVQQTQSLLGDFEGDILVTCGDVPLLTSETMQHLVEKRRETKSAAAMLIGVLDEPGAYGRVLCDEDGTVHSIVEAKDADDETLQKRTVNAGTYCFDAQKLWPQLARLNANNAAGELYLTDVIGFLTQGGETVSGVFIAEREMTGINTKQQLEELEFGLRAEGVGDA